jgi:mono/diheme cytochrome c family protein
VDAVQEAFRDGELSAKESHGRRVFAERCATCHGPQGRGDGQNAYNLQPPPPDFSESLGGLSVEDRRRVIEGGTAALGRSALCPPWGPSLRGEEVEALLAYMNVMARPPKDDEAPARGRRRWNRSRGR